MCDLDYERLIHLPKEIETLEKGEKERKEKKACYKYVVIHGVTKDLKGLNEELEEECEDLAESIMDDFSE